MPPMTGRGLSAGRVVASGKFSAVYPLLFSRQSAVLASKCTGYRAGQATAKYPTTQVGRRLNQILSLLIFCRNFLVSIASSVEAAPLWLAVLVLVVPSPLKRDIALIATALFSGHVYTT